VVEIVDCGVEHDNKNCVKSYFSQVFADVQCVCCCWSIYLRAGAERWFLLMSNGACFCVEC